MLRSRPPARRSGFPQENRQDQCDDDSVKQRLETGLVMRQRKTRVAFRHFHEPRSEYRAEQCTERKINEIDYARRRAAQFRWIRFFNDGVKNFWPLY
jgi:hypothetical protein